jgi:hypothetical protein
MKFPSRLLLSLACCAPIFLIKANAGLEPLASVDIIKAISKSTIASAMASGFISGVTSYVWAKYAQPLRDKSASLYSVVETLVPWITPLMLYQILKLQFKVRLASFSKSPEGVDFAATIFSVALALSSYPTSFLGSHVGYKAGIASN